MRCACQCRNLYGSARIPTCRRSCGYKEGHGRRERFIGIRLISSHLAPLWPFLRQQACLPHTSPVRPKSCRTCAASLGKGNASTRSLLGSNRRSGLAPKSLTYALSQLCRSVRLLVRVLCGLRTAVHYLSPPPLAKLLDALTGTRRDRDAHWMCTRTLWFTFPAAGRGKWLP